MAENLFGRVPIGGITPSEFELDFDTLFKERQADVADRQVAVSEGRLKLSSDQFERQKFTQDRTIKIAAAEKIAGFDLSNLPNELGVNFAYKLDKFKKDFQEGLLSPEELTIRANELEAAYKTDSNWYKASKDVIAKAIADGGKSLALMNQNTEADTKHTISKSLGQMNSEAGMFSVPDTYDPKDNTSMYEVQVGENVYQKRMTLDEARSKAATGELVVPTINQVGPYMTDKINVGVDSLYNLAISENHQGAITMRGKYGQYTEENAGFVFDSFLESGGEDQKKMRGAVRQLLETPSDERPAISLTPTQKITFDNGTIEEINNIPAIKAAGGYESVMAEARELYIDQALSERQDRPPYKKSGSGSTKTYQNLPTSNDVGPEMATEMIQDQTGAFSSVQREITRTVTVSGTRLGSTEDGLIFIIKPGDEFSPDKALSLTPNTSLYNALEDKINKTYGPGKFEELIGGLQDEPDTNYSKYNK